MKPDHVQPGAECYCGDCLAVLPHLPPASVDAVICDPPYPEIQRSYGRLTEAEWFGLMRALVPEVRRVLKPSGSAVFVLQPNSRKVGSMRPWLWQFMAWVCEDWNMVQDAYWWNTAALPLAGASGHGLMRASVKACVWAGPADCYRDQSRVLWEPSPRNVEKMAEGRWSRLQTHPSGHTTKNTRMVRAAARNGGATPYNLIPCPNTDNRDSGGAHGHPASTPLALCSWWVKYVSPAGGTVLDPYQGSGTVGLAALSLGRRYVGVEKEPDYHAIAVRRLTEAAGPLFANTGTVEIDSPPAPEPTLFPI